MAEAAWGSVTAKASGGGGSDPNILQLKDANRIRILDVPRKWRQHFIESPADPDKGRSVVCPKGPDGRDNQPCPLCMKPVDEKGKERFPISRRYAVNVWDYASEGVKVLIAGPQVFGEFDAAANVGLDPTASDWLIHKMGQGKTTSYKVVRGDAAPLSMQVTPDMLHDLSKYDTPTSQEKIFETLEELGIDYDSLETPSYTLEQAEAFQMPYGKFKGMTIEQLIANDPDYAGFIHRSKGEQGSYGDPVFIALQVVLEDRGLAEALDAVPATPPRPVTQSAPAAPTPAAPTQLADAATAAVGGPVPNGMVKLVGPDGSEVEVPEVAAAALRAAGYTDPKPPEPVAAEPADADMVVVDISGQQAELPYGSAKGLIASGAAKLVGPVTQQQPLSVPEPQFQPPADDAQVSFKLKVIPVPVDMTWADAKRLFTEGQGEPVDTLLLEHLQQTLTQHDAPTDAEVKAEIQQAAGADPTPPGGQTADLDPSLTVQGEDGRWRHPAIPGKDYAAKGAVTQALNRLKGEAPGGNSAPAAAQAAPAGSAPAGEATGKEAKLEQAKNLLAAMPQLQSDFSALLNLFQEVGGKRNIVEFDEAGLDALIARLQTMQVPAAA